MTDSRDNPFRQLPGLNALLEAAPDLDLQYGHGRAVAALRQALGEARTILKAVGTPPSAEQIVQRAHNLLQIKPYTQPVINATGVIINTNLGRAPLSMAAQQAILDVASGYSNLEYDLTTGERGKRETHIEPLLCELTGAEAATVVNNNAAATLLMLSALARDREVILSRGQLVEIGGGFRVPDVMAQSGARLVEVGTTNRTRIDDFADAITPHTALLLRVHSSNFKMIGFTEQPTLPEIATLAHKNNLIAADDLGSGALLDTARYGIEHEPTVRDSIKAGFHVVCFSADKLLGGPQAGIIVGKKALIARISKHPLARAVRIDKLSLAALAATLDHYKYDEAPAQLPVWRMISTPLEAIRARAERWAGEVGGAVLPARSTIGGGSLPGETLPTYILSVRVGNPAQVIARLRAQRPPVIARIVDNQIAFDPRTVLDGQDEALLAAIQACCLP